MQELASIMRFVLDASGHPNLYDHKVAQDFVFPAVYFPVPEVRTFGWTLSAYNAQALWFVNFFAETEHDVADMALSTLHALQRNHNHIPLMDETGAGIGRGFRLKDPSFKMVRDVAQLTLSWDSPRAYRVEDVQKAKEINTKIQQKG